MINAENLKTKYKEGKISLNFNFLERLTFSLCIYIYIKGVEKYSASCHVTSIACMAQYFENLLLKDNRENLEGYSYEIGVY